MKFAVVFLLLAVSFAILAAECGGLGWLLLWPAVSFLAVGVAYAGAGPAVLGKRSDGSMAWWAVVLWFPYFGLTWVLWQGSRLFGKEPCCHEIVPGLWVGRRALAHELPDGIDLVVDLTAELPEPRQVRAGWEYVCVATLDTLAPEGAAFQRLVERIAPWPGKVYIHCASGHGRSAAVAAAVLIARGLATDVGEAEKVLRKARPGIRLKPVQRALVVRTAKPRPNGPSPEARP